MSRCFTYFTSDIFPLPHSLPPPHLPLFLLPSSTSDIYTSLSRRSVTHLRYLHNGIISTDSRNWNSYVIMYYNNGLKQQWLIISHDSVYCLGNFFAGFVWPYLGTCIYLGSWMGLKVQDGLIHTSDSAGCSLGLLGFFSTWRLY